MHSSIKLQWLEGRIEGQYFIVLKYVYYISCNTSFLYEADSCHEVSGTASTVLQQYAPKPA